MYPMKVNKYMLLNLISTPNDKRLKQLLEEYTEKLRNNSITQRQEIHYREALFEESITAYYGEDAWMEINKR